MFNKDEYNRMWDALQAGQLTRNEWLSYCESLFDIK